MTRLLVLEGAGLAVPDSVIESIEPIELIELIESRADQALPWLPDLLRIPGPAIAPRPATGQRRTLRLHGGGAVEVPAAMHLVDGAQILALSSLLRPEGAGGCIIGVAELPDGLSLVCDPRQLVARGEPGQ